MVFTATPLTSYLQVGLCFTALTTVFFLFPPELPVTGTNMNYAVVVLGIICTFPPSHSSDQFK